MFFTDLQNRQWDIKITLASLKRCKDMTGLDPLGVIQSDSATGKTLAEDPTRIADIAYALIWHEGQISAEDFAAAIDGEVLERLSRAVIDAVIDFLPEKKRTPLRQTVDRLRALTERETAARLDELNNRLAAAEAAESTATPSSATATPPAASSASTPAV